MVGRNDGDVESLSSSSSQGHAGTRRPTTKDKRAAKEEFLEDERRDKLRSRLLLNLVAGFGLVNMVALCYFVMIFVEGHEKQKEVDPYVKPGLAVFGLLSFLSLLVVLVCPLIRIMIRRQSLDDRLKRGAMSFGTWGPKERQYAVQIEDAFEYRGRRKRGDKLPVFSYRKDKLEAQFEAMRKALMRKQMDADIDRRASQVQDLNALEDVDSTDLQQKMIKGAIAGDEDAPAPGTDISLGQTLSAKMAEIAEMERRAVANALKLEDVGDDDCGNISSLELSAIFRNPKLREKYVRYPVAAYDAAKSYQGEMIKSPEASCFHIFSPLYRSQILSNGSSLTSLSLEKPTRFEAGASETPLSMSRTFVNEELIKAASMAANADPLPVSRHTIGIFAIDSPRG